MYTYCYIFFPKGGESVNTGERIKRVREFRGLTQTAFGLLLGYPEKSASVRIAQYESSRMPKKDTLMEMSKILKCNINTLYTGDDLGLAEKTMQSLFWLEELVGSGFFVFKFDSYYDKASASFITAKYNEYNYSGTFPPIGIAMNYGLLNDFMQEWALRHEELKSKKITRDEYFEWKINWPDSCDDCGKITPNYKWRK
jgi:transcriptional regulator with XRE-family HTH domain